MRRDVLILVVLVMFIIFLSGCNTEEGFENTNIQENDGSSSSSGDCEDNQDMWVDKCKKLITDTKEGQNTSQLVEELDALSKELKPCITGGREEAEIFRSCKSFYNGLSKPKKMKENFWALADTPLPLLKVGYAIQLDACLKYPKGYSGISTGGTAYFGCWQIAEEMAEKSAKMETMENPMGIVEDPREQAIYDRLEEEWYELDFEMTKCTLAVIAIDSCEELYNDALEKWHIFIEKKQKYESGEDPSYSYTNVEAGSMNFVREYNEFLECRKKNPVEIDLSPGKADCSKEYYEYMLAKRIGEGNEKIKEQAYLTCVQG